MHPTLRWFLPVVFALCLALASQAESPPPGSNYEGEAFTFQEVRPGIFHAKGTGQLAVGSNSAVVVGEQDVLLVDSHMTPAAAWALQKELRKVTDKPIRYVVNTHFHFDHSHGNQIFGPDVEIIAHTFTHHMLATGGSTSGRAYESFVVTLPDQIAEIEGGLDDLPPENRAEAERVLEQTRSFLEASRAVKPTPPTLVLDRSLTLYRGGREIQLFFAGRGHTGGDVVVFLPAEGVLITGDLLTEGLPYMGDAYPQEWIATLETLKGLDFNLVLPGHGDPFLGKDKLSHLQAYLEDFLRLGREAFAAGIEPSEAASAMDLTHHSENFPQIRRPGVASHGLLRLYELLTAEGGD